MKIGSQTHHSSAISASNESTILVRGRDLTQELIGKISFTDHFWLLLAGAAIGFASVVSLMPGVYLFRMASGLVQICGGSPISPDLLSETVSSGMTALIIILAMSLGLIVPRMLIERVYVRRQRTRSLATKAHVDLW